MENKDQKPDILADLSEQYYEQRLEKAVKKVRRARLVLFSLLILLIYESIQTFSQGFFNTNAYVAYLVIGALLGLEVLSRKKPFISLFIASAIYVPATVYFLYHIMLIISENGDAGFLFSNTGFMLQILARLVLLSLLVIGTIHSWKYEKLLNESGN